MSRVDARGLLGGLLVLAGSLLLLQNLNVFLIPWDLFWAALFLAGGMAFLGVFLERPAHWWASIPAFTLLAIGALILLGATAPWLARAWGGSLFLGGIGLGFWLVFLSNRKNWWAVIPGGTLFTLAVVAGLPRVLSGPLAGAVLFLGLSATFGLVYLLADVPGRMGWALIPAAVLALLGIFILAASSALVGLVWPLLLILLGVYLVLRALRPRPR